MISVIDYDMGNLKSVAKALEKVGAKVCVTRDAKKIKSADKIVLPGVGAYPQCVENLKNYGLWDLIHHQIKSGKYFLGICLGLQLLFDESSEMGGAKGFGIISGEVKKFEFQNNENLKIPHMGWNQVQKKESAVLFKDIPQNTNFYFVHSFYGKPKDEKVVASSTNYGFSFCSSIEVDNILATQFHPEKSQESGLNILKNFVKIKG